MLKVERHREANLKDTVLEKQGCHEVRHLWRKKKSKEGHQPTYPEHLINFTR